MYVFALIFLRCSFDAASKKPSDIADRGEATLARYLLSLQPSVAAHTASRTQHRHGNAEMQFGYLFGNNEESKRRRDDLVLRTAPAGSNKLTFLKPPQSVQNPGKILGIVFEQNIIGNIFVKKILPDTEAEKYKQQGKLSEGDEVVMVSATFGEEMWSCRGVGVQRLYSSLKVRAGGNVAFVFESKGKNTKRQAEAAKDSEVRANRMARLQAEINNEANAAKEARRQSKEESGGGFKNPFENLFR